ncbi:MAG: hypothetical protein ALECFALPRED_000639 [Alectoria fallacina]|uniref:Uncharacterized protein n=1 Tax=Alectoria fallacina TaxID=1903189 RepID=A0A8H3F719_9LECA|nr:MAG: hypothetical protein ALECFALPRED_000639 [Alectoria fallacina]
MGSVCETALARYVDNFIYTNYTSLTYTYSANEPFTSDGCSAFFERGPSGSSSQPYGTGRYPSGGMSGADSKTAFGLIGYSVFGGMNWRKLGVWSSWMREEGVRIGLIGCIRIPRVRTRGLV